MTDLATTTTRGEDATEGLWSPIAPRTWASPVPQRVRATASADAVVVQMLLGETGPPSALDVDPRLLAVRRLPPPAPPALRTVEAPQDQRADALRTVRHRLAVASGALTAALLSALAVVQALA